MSQPAKELKELIAEVKKSYEEITRLKVENKKIEGRGVRSKKQAQAQGGRMTMKSAALVMVIIFTVSGCANSTAKRKSGSFRNASTRHIAHEH
jgi:hypothetical protein